MKEFIGLLSEHDVLEKYQLSKVTVAANALKLEVVNNILKMNSAVELLMLSTIKKSVI
ncbi:Uncharacterised protein [Escherichia coli]|uniref:Uncharacterized protein n=1 Tax=Escherichia coli TaxID=562 RepID=A0A485J8S1_ECOLX|nr:Uncharacterised protein [Escherichia coli]